MCHANGNLETIEKYRVDSQRAGSTTRGNLRPLASCLLRWLFYVSPCAYPLGVMVTAIIQNQPVTVDLTTFTPPHIQTCGVYVSFGLTRHTHV